MNVEGEDANMPLRSKYPSSFPLVDFCAIQYVAALKQAQKPWWASVFSVRTKVTPDRVTSGRS